MRSAPRPAKLEETPCVTLVRAVVERAPTENVDAPKAFIVPRIVLLFCPTGKSSIITLAGAIDAENAPPAFVAPVEPITFVPLKLPPKVPAFISDPEIAPFGNSPVEMPTLNADGLARIEFIRSGVSVKVREKLPF